MASMTSSSSVQAGVDRMFVDSRAGGNLLADVFTEACEFGPTLVVLEDIAICPSSVAAITSAKRPRYQRADADSVRPVSQ